ncbi:MAG: hypothetical protein OHK0024_07140 [Thalassobaculales bacterium]
MSPDLWWSYLPFHLINYALAALFYTMFGRFGLSFILPPQSPNYIWRWFCRLTDPVLRLVWIITPGYIADRFMPLCGAFWIGFARVLFFIAAYSWGLAPTLTPAGG